MDKTPTSPVSDSEMDVLTTGQVICESAKLLSTLSDGLHLAAIVDLDPNDLEAFYVVIREIRHVLTQCHLLVKDGRGTLGQVHSTIRETLECLNWMNGKAPEDHRETRLKEIVSEGWRRQRDATQKFPDINPLRDAIDCLVHDLGKFRNSIDAKQSIKRRSSWTNFFVAAGLMAVGGLLIAAAVVFLPGTAAVAAVGLSVVGLLMIPGVRQAVVGAKDRIMGNRYKEISNSLKPAGEGVHDLHRRVIELDEMVSFAQSNSDRDGSTTPTTNDKASVSCIVVLPNLPLDFDAIPMWTSAFQELEKQWTSVSMSLERLSEAHLKCLESLSAIGCRKAPEPAASWFGARVCTIM